MESLGFDHKHNSLLIDEFTETRRASPQSIQADLDAMGIGAAIDPQSLEADTMQGIQKGIDNLKQVHECWRALANEELGQDQQDRKDEQDELDNEWLLLANERDHRGVRSSDLRPPAPKVALQPSKSTSGNQYPACVRAWTPEKELPTKEEQAARFGQRLPTEFPISNVRSEVAPHSNPGIRQTRLDCIVGPFPRRLGRDMELALLLEYLRNGQSPIRGRSIADLPYPLSEPSFLEDVTVVFMLKDGLRSPESEHDLADKILAAVDVFDREWPKLRRRVRGQQAKIDPKQGVPASWSFTISGRMASAMETTMDRMGLANCRDPLAVLMKGLLMLRADRVREAQLEVRGLLANIPEYEGF
jgi:hypothetical protein